MRSLLAQKAELEQLARAARVLVEHDVVAYGGRGPEAVDAACAKQPALDDLAQQLARVVIEIACRRPDPGVVEDLRETALQLPGVEEERPVDVVGECGERHIVEHLHTEERRGGEIVLVPLDRRAVGARLRVGQERLSLLVGM